MTNSSGISSNGKGSMGGGEYVLGATVSSFNAVLPNGTKTIAVPGMHR